MRVGVLGAMPEEVAAVIAMLTEPQVTHAGGRDYTHGSHAGHGVVAVHSRIGKVAAAAAAVEFIVRFGVEQIVFTGLAGALASDLHVGDVVVADGLVQHDMDASPLFPPLEVPLTGCSRFEANRGIADRLTASAQAVLARPGTLISVILDGRRGLHPRVLHGDIATGDRFVASHASRTAVLERVPSALCVEMEGAAVAQVCAEYGVPFGVVRLISDGANETAADDFTKALGEIAADFAGAVVADYLESL